MVIVTARSSYIMACRCQRVVVRINNSVRPFSSSARRSNSLHLGLNDREQVANVVPAYPYGPAQWYKQSDLGLYGGQRIMFGNNTSEKYQTRKRRTWGLNVKTKRLWSNALGRFVQLRVTTRVLRTIDKLGGLDEYLLGEKEQRIKDLGETGWWLRWAIMQTPAVRQKFEKERQEYGLNEESSYRPSEDNTALGKGAEDTKEGLRFRVGGRRYLLYKDGSWQYRKAIIGHLSFLLWTHSPSQAIKRWQVIEQNFEKRMATFKLAEGERIKGKERDKLPTLENVRAAFFAKEKMRTQQIRKEISKLGETALESEALINHGRGRLEWKPSAPRSRRELRAADKESKATRKEAADDWEDVSSER